MRDDDLVGVWFGGEVGMKYFVRGGESGVEGERGGLCGWIAVRSWIERFGEA
jgi:hypothetical protein